LWLLKRRVFFTAFTFFLLSFPVFFFTIVQEIFSDGKSQASVEEKKTKLKAPKDEQQQSRPAHKIFYVRAATNPYVPLFAIKNHSNYPCTATSTEGKILRIPHPLL
jgi:hypothetical protein